MYFHKYNLIHRRMINTYENKIVMILLVLQPHSYEYEYFMYI